MIIKQQYWAWNFVGLQPISGLLTLYYFSIDYYYYWMRIKPILTTS